MAFSVAFPISAQTVVTSSAPISTSVTVYRDAGRGDARINPGWVNGYALISEKRRVSLPAGDAVIRFEGVAGGMVAVSAVVTGLPGGVDEKNRDARLLSPASLLDGSLGNRVHLKRKNRRTGKVSEQDAIIRSGPAGAVVLQSAEGIEALRCSGLPETLVYDAVPEGLTAKPSFSVHTSSPSLSVAEVTLTYLATGFDWSASYVARVAEDGKTLDLSAWLTVANGNDVIYSDAQLLAVAGEPNKQSDFDALVVRAPAPQLNIKCWPMDGTSTHDAWGLPVAPPSSPIMMTMPAPMMARGEYDDLAEISVTAQKRIAKQEDLGDLKLYRVPMPVEIAPNGQKQVALLAKEGVPFTLFYMADISTWDGDDEQSHPLTRIVRMQNKQKDGLGLPLPSGGIVVMQKQGGEEMLLADVKMVDKAIGEKVEVAAGESDQVRYVFTHIPDKGLDSFRLDISNATNRAAVVEIKLGMDDTDQIEKMSSKIVRQDGRWMWKATVPANGVSTLKFSVKRQ